MDSMDKSVMSFVARLHTQALFMCADVHTNTQNALKKINWAGKPQKTHILYNKCIHHTQTQKTKDKERNSIDDWPKIAVSCCHSKQRTRQVAQMCFSMGMVCSIFSSFLCNSQLLCTSHLSFVCFVVFLFYCFS